MEKFTARGRSLFVLGCLFVLSVGVYIAGPHTGWRDTWIPSVITTWVGLFVVVLILDEFRKQEERRVRGPVRKVAGANLGSALEPIVAFALYLQPTEDVIEAPELVRGTGLNLWPRSKQGLDTVRSNWHTTLRETEARLTTFLAAWDMYLEPEERGQVEQLRTYASDVARKQNPWTYPIRQEEDVPGIRYQVFETWRDAKSPFCSAAEVYKTLTGSPLTGAYSDFKPAFRLRLPASANR